MTDAPKEEQAASQAPAKKLHPDSTYIMQDNIGPVIAKGLAQVYKEKPTNPVDFFAKWLLNQARIQKSQNKEKQAEVAVQKLKDKRDYEDAKKAKLVAEKEEEKKALDQQIVDFEKKVQASDDLNDQLQDLVDHVK